MNQALRLSHVSSKAFVLRQIWALTIVGLAALLFLTPSQAAPVNSQTTLRSIQLHAVPLSFAPAVSINVGTNPSAVAAGDFNRDGKSDLVVANSGDNNLSVILGNGAGSFGATVNFPAGANPVAVAVADFNQDNKPDLVTANNSDNNISILLGDGAGGFAGTVNFDAGTSPVSLVAADFNRDGKLDIAVANNASGNVSLLLGDGLGGFGTASNFTAGSGPTSLTSGDFNRDGKLDLVVSNSSSNNLSFLAGDGNGGFASATSFVVGNGPRFVLAGDFKTDGKLDLIAINNASNNLSLLTGTGTGNFTSGGVFAVGSNPTAAISRDFNGDGKLDLAVSNNGSNNLSLLSGDGAGNFGTALNFGTETGPAALTSADFNRDGWPDVVTANHDNNSLSLLLNSSAGCGQNDFTPAVNFNLNGQPAFITVGDFNLDGLSDLLTLNPATGNFSRLAGNGAGGFGTVQTSSSGSYRSGATGDFNGDAIPDLVATNSSNNSIVLLLGTGNGSFGSPVNFQVGINPLALTIGDFNRDGKLDVAVVNSTSQSVSILLGDGTGGFNPAPGFATAANPRLIKAADLNKDGKTDLVITYNSGNNLDVFAGDGSSNFMAPVPYNAAANPSALAIGDFNRDGWPDLAVASEQGSNINILLNTTSGFSPATAYPLTYAPVAIVTDDFNGDGILDLVTASQTGNKVTVLSGNASGGFAVKSTLPVGSSPSALVSGDFDQDGRPDLAVANFGNSNVSVLLNQKLATSFSLSTSDSAFIGIPITASVTALDLCGRVAKGYRGTIFFSSSDAGATLPPNYSFTASDNGVKSFSVTFNNPGNHTLTVIDASNSLINESASVAVTGQPASLTPVEGTPQQTVVMTDFATHFKTLVKDGFNNPIRNITVTFTVSASGPSGFFPGGTNVVTAKSDATGIAVAPTFTANCRAGNYNLTATVGTMVNPALFSLTNKPDQPVIVTADAGSNQATPINTLFKQHLKVAVRDRCGNPTGGDGNITITFTGPGAGAEGDFQGSNVVTVGAGGVVLAPPLKANAVTGIYKIKAQATGISNPAYFRLMNLANSATANPAVPQFNMPDYISGNGTGQVLAEDDLNGDGKADLAVAQPFDASLWVYLGNDDGTFQNGLNFAPGYISNLIAIGDVDNDGRLDLVSVKGAIYLLPGKGDGTFGSPRLTPLPGGLAPANVTLADLNGDGMEDVITSNGYNSGAIGVWLSKGDGTFQSQVTYAAGSEPRMVATGDFNGDGKVDLVAANGYGNTNVSVFIGNGDGTFQAAVNYTVATSPLWIGVGDFNGDEKLDLAVTSYSNLTILAGNGDGTFQSGNPLSLQAYSTQLGVNDFNRDGRLDLLVSNDYGAVSVLTGNGNGTFQSTPVLLGSTNYNWSGAADFNEDGGVDVAWTGVTGTANPPGGLRVALQAQAVCTNPLTVTSPTDDGTGSYCGTLSNAIQQANTGSNKTIIFALTGGGKTITLSQAAVILPKPGKGVVINGGDCNSGTGITIDGNSHNFSGLQVDGGVTLINLEIVNFKGSGIISRTVNNERNIFNCVRIKR